MLTHSCMLQLAEEEQEIKKLMQLQELLADYDEDDEEYNVCTVISLIFVIYTFLLVCFKEKL